MTKKVLNNPSWLKKSLANPNKTVRSPKFSDIKTFKNRNQSIINSFHVRLPHSTYAFDFTFWFRNSKFERAQDFFFCNYTNTKCWYGLFLFSCSSQTSFKIFALSDKFNDSIGNPSFFVKRLFCFLHGTFFRFWTRVRRFQVENSIFQFFHQ